MPNTSGCYSLEVRGGTEPQSISDAIADGRSEVAPVEIHMVVGEASRPSTYEVWTKDVIYEFDASMHCVGVRETSSGKPSSAVRQYVGAKLIGGRSVEGETVHMSYPLPAVGHRALLSRDEHDMAVTKPVARVIMNLELWTCATKPGSFPGAR
jgi:hypothetical protein